MKVPKMIIASDSVIPVAESNMKQLAGAHFTTKMQEGLYHEL